MDNVINVLTWKNYNKFKKWKWLLQIVLNKTFLQEQEQPFVNFDKFNLYAVMLCLMSGLCLTPSKKLGKLYLKGPIMLSTFLSQEAHLKLMWLCILLHVLWLITTVLWVYWSDSGQKVKVTELFKILSALTVTSLLTCCGCKWYLNVLINCLTLTALT